MFYQPLLIGNDPYCAEIIPITSFGEHWHNEIEIIRCLSGNFKVKTGGMEHAVGKDETVIIASAEPHEYYDCEPGTEIQYIEFGAMFLGNDFGIISELSFTKPVISPDKESPNYCEVSHDLYLILKKLKNECINPTAAHNWILKSCLYEISALILSLPSKRGLTAERKKRMDAISVMKPVLDYISENYTRDITLDEISRVAGYGKSNFCKHFKMATHMSFHRYLNMCRIDRACVLLADKHMTVGQIGERLGFNEIKTFCRVFKQIMNMTPSEYRNINL